MNTDDEQCGGGGRIKAPALSYLKPDGSLFLFISSGPPKRRNRQFGGQLVFGFSLDSLRRSIVDQVLTSGLSPFFYGLSVSFFSRVSLVETLSSLVDDLCY